MTAHKNHKLEVSRRVTRVLSSMLLVALCTSGCKETQGPKLADRHTRAKDTTPTQEDVGPLALELSIARAQMPTAIEADWVPDEQAVRQVLVAKLIDSKVASLSEQGRRAKLDYAALRIAPPQEPEKLALAASITLEEPPPRWTDSRIERIATLDPMPEKDTKKREELDRVMAELAEAVHARHALAMTPDKDLVKMLRTRDSITIEQAHDALERLRSRHKQTPYEGTQKVQVIELLEQLATRQEPSLLTGVFAALREFGASGYGKLIVDAATGSSQRGEYPAFLALLAMMGEVKEPEVKAYLESVAVGHPEESFRQIASESLARHTP